MHKKILFILFVLCNMAFSGGSCSKKRTEQSSKVAGKKVGRVRSLDSEFQEAESWNIWVGYSCVESKDRPITRREMLEARKNQKRSKSKSKLFLIQELSDSEE